MQPMILGLPLSFLLLLAVILFYAIDFFFLLRYDRERQTGKGWAWDYTLLTIGGALLVILQPWFLPFLGLAIRQTWGLWIQIAGCVCCLSSFTIHIWSRLHLQKFYAERVEVQTDHRVIQTGPYAYVRHPVITSFFLLAIGLLLLAPAVTTLLSLIYALWDFTRAARQEEELLASNLPGYVDYMKRVPRFFALRRGIQ
jgi:protein-S-isoprenylcysteine O-methyltransferase Ste14